MSEENLKKRFFVLLRFIYRIMPESFKKQVPESKFYRYIQDERKEYGVDNASIKNLSTQQFKIFVKEFLSFTYLNVVGYYFALDRVEDIELKVNQEFKMFFKELENE